MRIDSITKKDNSANLVNVRFEDGQDITVNATQLADHMLYTGREMDEEEIERLVGDVKLGLAKARAMRILGNRNLSVREMERRLRCKGESPETSKQTVEWLENAGFLDDEDYASKIVKHYSCKGYGLARIKEELFRRGIERDLWDDALSQIDCLEDAAYELLEKRMKGSVDKADLRKSTGFLLRRGYSHEETRLAAKKYMESRQQDVEL